MHKLLRLRGVRDLMSGLFRKSIDGFIMIGSRRNVEE